MAIIKAVSSGAPISTAINYVTETEKTESKLISGYNLQSADTAAEEMQLTKELWNKTGGRTYKHFVQSFAPDEEITPQLAHDIATEFVEKCPIFKDFEVLIATHEDKDHIHTHIVMNSVNLKDGHKFQMHADELQAMKDLSDSICSSYGLSICCKGQTFGGEEREETTAYTKEQYRLLKKAENGAAESYVQDIALAAMQAIEDSRSREEFVEKMRESGYKVDWSDSRKYITFTDIEREQAGEKKCKVRNSTLEKYYHIDFSKGAIERELETNAQRAASQEQADKLAAAAERGRTALTHSAANRRAGESDLDQSRADTESAAAHRRERELARERRRIAESQAAERELQAAEKRIRQQSSGITITQHRAR